MKMKMKVNVGNWCLKKLKTVIVFVAAILM